VRRENRQLYNRELDDYFRARHAVYVKERGWKELDRPDGREIDQYDTDKAIHLIALEGSRVVGGHRFIPTTGPNMIAEVFPHLTVAGPLCAADAYETSRIFVVRDRRGDQSFPKVESLVLAGTIEFALVEGIKKITFVMETWWFPRLEEIGWRLRPLGLPYDVKGMSCLAVSVDVNEETWIATCQARFVGGPVLVWRGLPRRELDLPALLRATG
jgi:acyl-homoserine lactone synthase